MKRNLKERNLNNKYKNSGVLTLHKRQDVENFSKELREVLMFKNITGKKLSEVIGMSQSTISTYVRGERIPKIYALHMMEKALDESFSNYYPLGEVLKLAMQDKEISMANLAKKIDKSNNEVRNYIKNKKIPKLKTMKALENVLEVDLSKYYPEFDAVNTFGEKLRLGVEENEMTGEEFAKMIGKSRETVSNYMRNIYTPSISTIKQIEKVLGISFSEYYPSIKDAKTFGQKLKIAMECKGITIAELAKEIHKHDVVVSDYIKDRKIPKKKTMITLEKILDVSFEEYRCSFDGINTFEEKLRLALKENEMSIREFSKELNVCIITVNKYLKGYIPKVSILKEMERILGVSFSEFLPDYTKASSFGEKLKLALEYKEISKKELASKIGMSNSMIHKYIVYGAMPKKATIQKIEAALNISFEEYYHGADKKLCVAGEKAELEVIDQYVGTVGKETKIVYMKGDNIKIKKKHQNEELETALA